MFFTTVVPIPELLIESAMQARGNVDPETIRDYAARLAAGDIFPPVEARRDGTKYRLIDGFHRIEAYKLSGRETIEVRWCEGSLRDAFKASLSANSTHGKTRTNEEKREAVKRALADEEIAGLSDRKIAELCRVSARLVVDRRREIANVNVQVEAEATSPVPGQQHPRPDNPVNSVLSSEAATRSAGQRSVPRDLEEEGKLFSVNRSKLSEEMREVLENTMRASAGERAAMFKDAVQLSGERYGEMYDELSRLESEASAIRRAINQWERKESVRLDLQEGIASPAVLHFAWSRHTAKLRKASRPPVVEQQAPI